MASSDSAPKLAQTPDFTLGALRVSPSACRVFAGGEEIRVEAKTMAVMVTLARAEGGTVTRDELIDACWDGRVVSDDAVTRAIAKVRLLAKGVDPEPFILETVPKVGFRLIPGAAPVMSAPERAATPPPVAEAAPLAAPPTQALPDQASPLELAPPMPVPSASAIVRTEGFQPPASKSRSKHLIQRAAIWAAAAALAATGPFAASFLSKWMDERENASAPPSGLRSEVVLEALHNLDEARLRAYLDAGWRPNWTFDSELNTALHRLMEACERHQSHHDRRAVVRIAEMLVAAGADPHAKNTHQDTPLSIARSVRYCKADHPVVAYLTSLDAAAGAPPP